MLVLVLCDATRSHPVYKKIILHHGKFHFSFQKMRKKTSTLPEVKVESQTLLKIEIYDPSIEKFLLEFDGDSALEWETLTPQMFMKYKQLFEEFAQEHPNCKGAIEAVRKTAQTDSLQPTKVSVYSTPQNTHTKLLEKKPPSPAHFSLLLQETSSLSSSSSSTSTAKRVRTASDLVKTRNNRNSQLVDKDV